MYWIYISQYRIHRYDMMHTFMTTKSLKSFNRLEGFHITLLIGETFVNK